RAANQGWKFNVMKKYQLMLAAGLCTGVFCASAARAETGPYVGADVGGALTLDTRVKEFVGPVGSNTKMQLDPGVRVGLHGGYRLCDFFSIEAETGVIANNIKSIPGASIDGNATLSNVPFLVNARIELPLRNSRITPYFGGGAGGSATVLSFEHHIDFNGTQLHGTDSDVVAAYQAFGGIRYAINDHMDVGVEYHYFATTGASWSVNNVGTPNKIGLAGVQSHTITAAFNYRF